MNIEEFKKHIENKDLPNTSYIFICKGNAEFIFHQYINQYAEDNNLDIEVVNELPNNSINLFGIQNTSLKIYETDKLTNYTNPDNVWVKTKSVDKKVKEQFEDIIVDLGKLEDWHIKDYVYTFCTGVPNDELEYMLKVYGNNIYRIDNEIQKILLFDNRDNIVSIIKDQLYTDVSEFNIFDLTNAIMKHDITSLKNILIQLDSIDVDAFGFLKILTDNFRNVLNIQTSRHATADTLGISAKQFWAVKKFNCGHYTNEQIYSIYKFLTSTDYLIKSGYISTNDIISYTIIKIMTIGGKR